MSIIFLPLLFFFFGGLWVIGRGTYEIIKMGKDEDDYVTRGAKMSAVSFFLIFLLVKLTGVQDILIEPDGTFTRIDGKVRYLLDRRAFLDQQEILVDINLARIINGPTGAQTVSEARAKTEEVMSQVQPLFDQVVSDFYADHPELVPSQEQMLAKRLRKQADKLEAQELNRKWAAWRDHENAEELARLRRIKEIIKSMH